MEKGGHAKIAHSNLVTNGFCGNFLKKSRTSYKVGSKGAVTQV